MEVMSMLDSIQGQVRVATWNINGPGASRLPAIVEYLETLDADLLVLTEYIADRGAGLIDMVRQAGWPHVVTNTNGGSENGILIAAHTPVSPTGTRIEPAMATGLLASNEYFAKRWLEANVPAWHVPGATGPITIGGVHIPDVGGSGDERRLKERRKEAFCDTLHEILTESALAPYMLIGDLNTGFDTDIVELASGLPARPETLGANSRFWYPVALERLRDQLGWSDAWRMSHPGRYEFTWKGKVNGFRLDQAWLSPALRPTIQDAMHLTTAWDALNVTHGAPRRSDHAALVVDMRVMVNCDRSGS
jgi:exonuclease III